MLHIALCDDEADHRQLTHELLNTYFADRGVAAKIWRFPDGQSLLNAVLDNPFDLYLLDILMPEMDGIDLGLALRKRDENGVIIYLTTSPDFALEGYSVKAASYLLKPVSEEKLFSALDDARKTISNRRTQIVMVKTAEGTNRLLLDDILYVEQIDRLPHYYLYDGSCVVGVTIRTSFQEAMKPLLSDRRFYLCGASFVFNLHHIKSVTKSNACIGSRQVPVPKRTAAELHTAWMHYWLEGGTQL
ncbi:MAG: response regulator transcription factor [Anaerotignum sp.]|nr:response regulator transcription factor [Anaerotignum sp.]